MRRDIQRLRAFAVLLVILYHLPPAWNLEGGFVGVDIFFVISGYVISGTILRESTGEAAFRHLYFDFMRRRIRRLVPPLLAAVGAGLLLAFLFAPASNFREVVSASRLSAVFGTNFYFLNHFDTY